MIFHQYQKQLEFLKFNGHTRKILKARAIPVKLITHLDKGEVVI